MKVSEISKIIEESITNEVMETILKESKGGVDKFAVKCGEDHVELFDTEEEANKSCEGYNEQHPNKEFTVKQETYDSIEEMYDSLDELGEELEKETNNMKNQDSLDEKLHGNQAELDKNGDGKLTTTDFELLRDKEEVSEGTCDHCGKELCECGELEESIDDLKCEKCGDTDCKCESVNESTQSKKRTLRLSESQLIDMVSKMVKESIPGLDAVKNAQKEGDKETKEHMANVDQKLKKALSFDGNDNPEFPNPIGKGETMAVNNTEEQDEEMSMDRGESILDLDYDTDPGDKFKERVKKALEGDATMGNAEGGNTIPTKTGENLQKTAEKRKEYKENAPMYVKDLQPVKSSKVVNESTVVKKPSVLEEEIQKMKKLTSYNEKTQ